MAIEIPLSLILEKLEIIGDDLDQAYLSFMTSFITRTAQGKKLFLAVTTNTRRLVVIMYSGFNRWIIAGFTKLLDWVAAIA
jgi:hypothetical protein